MQTLLRLVCLGRQPSDNRQPVLNDTKRFRLHRSHPGWTQQFVSAERFGRLNRVLFVVVYLSHGIPEHTTMSTFRILVMLFVGVLAVPESLAQSFPFAISGDDGSPSVTDRSVLLKDGIPQDFVSIKDGHFAVADQRVRFWGVNLCFGANFPTHDEADKLAPHFAKLGINAVRFHHMDMQDAPNGIWAPVDDEGVRKLHPEMVDRLDYFLARLHENGIYANLNLHVSRTLSEAEGYPSVDGVPWWAGSNKWVMYYDRDVQAELKRYCRDLLAHPNPYRNHLKRVDDPGIAIVEMLNENYFSEQGYDLYRQMPEQFQQSLIVRWNEWLLAKYASESEMLKQWKNAQPQLADFQISKAAWSTGVDGWVVSEPPAGIKTTFGNQSPGPGQAIRLAPGATTEQDHEQQLRYHGLTVEKGKPLTLTYWVRSDGPRKYRAEISSSAGGEWRALGLFETLTATPEWQKIERVIIPGESLAAKANFSFTFGSDTTPIEFAAVTLQQGSAARELPKGQSLAARSIGIPEGGWPVQAHQDMKLFMIDTEVQWTLELKNFLKDLGVKVPITASQVNYHNQRVHDEVNDFVDLHNYWHHPMFPSGANWSPDRWTVGNEPMEAQPIRSSWPANSLLMRTGWRNTGKPMTLSEWNYPEPSPYSAGCVPMAAMLASLQDWDAIYFFDYDAFSRNQDSSPFFRNQTTNFFSFNGQPVKLATFSQCANLFLRGDLEPLVDEITSHPDAPIDGRLALTAKLGVSSSASTITRDLPEATNLATPDGSVKWTSNGKDQGQIQVDTPASKGLWGTIANTNVMIGDIRLETGNIQPNYGIVLLSSTDGARTGENGSSILLVASHTENQNMGWNEDRTSVGQNWGTGPSQVTSFNVTLTMPASTTVRCYALDGQGQRVKEVPVSIEGGKTNIEVGPEYHTLWYEIVAE